MYFLSSADKPQALSAGDHFGKVAKVRKLGELIVAESRYRPGFTTPVHWHETASFTVVIAGSYEERFSRHSIDCGYGSMLFRPAGESHRDRIGSTGAHCLMVEVSHAWVQRMMTGGLALAVPRQGHDSNGFLARIRREVAFPDELSPIVLEGLVMELACDAQRSNFRGKRAPLWLRRVRERIAAEFFAMPPLQTLANDAGVHPGHMARAFRQHFGCTVGEYGRQKRIEYCQQRLRRTESPLSEIAVAAGFASQAHFNRVFKLQSGITPSEFRRAALRGCELQTKTLLA